MKTKVGFIGFGLIAGSLAHALKESGRDYHITATSRHLEPVIAAVADGIVDVAAPAVDETFAQCDIILLCTPVITITEYLTKLKAIASPDCIITDVGSVKTIIHEAADSLGLNTPWTIPVIYLGFGAGMAVFMFTGFIKGLPLEIEEAAAIDGCGPIRTFFIVIIPMLKPTLISVGILEIMWIWNDYLLPYLVLDLDKYRTIPIHIQYLQGSYGSVDLGAIMALIILSIIPVIIFYLTCQKHIIKGVAAGAVKG